VSGRRVDEDGAMLRVYSTQPAADAPSVLAALGDHAVRLKSVEIVAPSLEAVFLALTGRRYDSEQQAADVPVA
jgi:hypothetical protein